ncbi:MAG TPA: peptide chain release factor H [Pseudobacteroides sp.]|uniref:peptide chain release factor H n=1 Tax=Pseudobacteroides sp. TaxID=1968840 RepID=UPI002F926F45
MWIQISSGRGPDECELAVGLFLKDFQKECTEKGINTQVLDAELGNKKGNFKSVLVSLHLDEGSAEVVPVDVVPADAYNSSIISGTILWICKSPYRPNHKRKNWFINIEVLKPPEKLEFQEKDVKFESMRSSGPGDQNVNKVETAVRAFHLPTGFTVTASEERSQYMNKKLALTRLVALIKSKNHEGNENHKKDAWMQHNTLERGNPVRVYEGSSFKLIKKDINGEF